MVDENVNVNDLKENINDCDKIQLIGYSSFVYALMFSSFLGMATFNIFNIAKVDCCISVIIGSIIGIIPLLLILYIIKHSRGENILDLNISVFGKVFGTIMNILLNIFTLVFASLILYNVALFLDTQYIPDTNRLYVKILLILPIVYAASKDIATISRVSQILLVANIILFLLSFIGVVEEINLNNLLPVMADGITNPLLGGIEYVIFGVLPLFFLTFMPSKLVPMKEKISKRVTVMYAISCFIILVIYFIIISVLGYEIASIYKYPEYMVLKHFSLFEIIERIENTLAIQNVFCIFIFISLCVYFIKISLKKVFKKVKSQQLFPYLIGIAMIVISKIIFKDSDTSSRFISDVVPYITGISLSLFIIITFIGVFIREKRCKVVVNKIS